MELDYEEIVKSARKSLATASEEKEQLEEANQLNAATHMQYLQLERICLALLAIAVRLGEMK